MQKARAVHSDSKRQVVNRMHPQTGDFSCICASEAGLNHVIPARAGIYLNPCMVFE